MVSNEHLAKSQIDTVYDVDNDFDGDVHYSDENCDNHNNDHVYHDS